MDRLRFLFLVSVFFQIEVLLLVISPAYGASTNCTSGSGCPSNLICQGGHCQCPASMYYHTPTEQCVLKCSSMTNETGGYVTSPNYPNVYPNNTYCMWIIRGQPGTFIRFSTTDSLIESSSQCSKDSLEFFDGPSVDHPSLGRSCGDSKPCVISSGEYLAIVFKSGPRSRGRGFLGSFQNYNCNMTLSGRTGHVTSPGGGAGYFNKLRCLTKLVGDVGTVMTLSFSSFEVESEILCRYDVVEVYDGLIADQKRIGRVCGDITPPRMVATSNIMSIYFGSDTNREKKGYNGTFLAFDCNTTLTATSGLITSPGYPQGYFNNLYCWLTIVGEPGTFISLYVRDVSIEQCYNCACDYVQFFDGPTNSSRSLGRQCTFVYGSVVHSSTNVMSVLFYSNKNLTYRGFKASYIINDLPFGSTCSNALQCEIGLDCEGETCSCPRHQYYDMTAKQCWDKRLKGSLCNADEECFDTMVCIQWSCECAADTFYNNVTLTCHNKQALGEVCNNSLPGMCQSPNLDCVPDDVGVYRCLHENQTRIVECPREPELESIHIEEKGTTFIHLKWKLLNLDQNVIIRVNWSFSGIPTENGEQLAGLSGANITVLTPGQEYNFTIVAVLGDGTQKAAVLVLYSFVAAMLPGTPGGDSSRISHVPTPHTSDILTPPPNLILTPPYSLTFPPSPGVVDHYHITLTSASTTSVHQTTTTRLALTGLRPDTAYGYSVVAYNTHGEYSRPLTGVFVTAPETTAIPLDAGDDHVDWKNVFIVGIVTSLIFCLAISTCWLTSWALGRRRTRDQLKMKSIQSDEKTFCNELSARYVEVKDNEYDKPSRNDYGEENLYSTTAGTLQYTGRGNKSLARNKQGEVNHTVTYTNPEETDNTGERSEYVPPDLTNKQEENNEDRDDYLEPVVNCDLNLKTNSIDKVSPKSKNDNSKTQEIKGQVNEYILPDLDTYFTITEATEKKTDDSMDEKLPDQNMNCDVMKTVPLVSEIYHNQETSVAYGNFSVDNQIQVVVL